MKKTTLLWIGLALAFILLAIPLANATALDTMPPPIDPQSWKIQEHMTWDDWTPNPVINWESNDPIKYGITAKRPLKGMLILADFPDRSFISGEPLGSELIGNPLVGETDREKLAKFWVDFLNTPSKDNNFTTLNGYWLENSYGDWTVELDACGPYTLSRFEFQYGFFGNYTPTGFQEQFGNRVSAGAEAYDLAKADGIQFFKPNEAGTDREMIYDFVFVLHAGYAQSGTWQELGEMMFLDQNNVHNVPAGTLKHPLTGEIMPDVSGYDFSGEARIDKILARVNSTGFDIKKEWPNFYLFNDIATQNAEFAKAQTSDPTLARETFDAAYPDMVQGILVDKLLASKAEAKNYAANLSFGWVRTRYIPWTSWYGGLGIWSGAGSATDRETGWPNKTIPLSIQGENNGMGTFAHEFGHLMGLPDNYNNPYSNPMQRSYSGPWELMSRGSFGGPGGNHSRFDIPSKRGESIPSNQVLRSKLINGFTTPSDIVDITYASLLEAPVITKIVARNIPTGKGVTDGYGKPIEGDRGIRITAMVDQTPRGGGENNTLAGTNGERVDPDKWNWGSFSGQNYNGYHIEVVERTGYDSFTPDHGVMITKTTPGGSVTNFVQDAHPTPLGLVDFVRANGEIAMISDGDQYQLASALYHAGVHDNPTYYRNEYPEKFVDSDPRPGVHGNVVNEYVDEYNKLHFYILDKYENRGKYGYFLSYQVGVLRTDGAPVGGDLKVELVSIEAEAPGRVAVVSYDITNTGDATDIVRVATGGDMKGILLNNLYAIGAGETVTVSYYVDIPEGMTTLADMKINLTVSSESNSAKEATDSILVEDLLASHNFTVWLEAEQTLLDIGDFLYVDVMLKGNINYTLAETKVAYDTNLFEYLGYENLSGWMTQIQKEAPNLITTCNVPAINMNIGASSAEGVKLITLKFKVKDTFSDERIEAVLSFDTINVYSTPDMPSPSIAPNKELPLVLFGPAFVQGLYKNIELYPEWIVDGDTQPIFTYADAITEIVWVEVPCDTDRDGLRDRVSVWIMRPKTEDGFRCPVMLEHSPYHHSTVGWSAVSGSAFDGEYDYMREPFRYRDNWPIHKDPDNPAFADTTHLTYDDIKYKGIESYEWPWVDKAFETGSWYTGTNYGNVPAATVSALDTKGNVIYEPASSYNSFISNTSFYRYYLPRGYALVYGQLLGALDGDGITNTLHVEEVLSAMAVINWLNGEAKGYTTRRGNVEVKADWANGNVGMTGTSYPADTAFATVVSGVNGLKAVMPQCNGLNWYDYYRYAGAVNAPGGYAGEDLNLHASLNFTRWRADGISNGQIPPADGQWFPKSIQDVFFETQNHMIEKEDRVTGDYNAEWELRNFGRLVENINEDVGLLMTTGFMDWNSQPKLSMANWTVLLDKCPGTFKEFASISSHTSQAPAVIHGKSIVEWWHLWMDHFLLGLDNGVVEDLPDLTVVNTKTGDVEGYWIKGNPNAQPGDADYEPAFLERGGIVPGARNQTLYLVPGKDGKAGRLSYSEPPAAVDHFSDMDILDMLQSTYPGCTILTDAQKTVNRSGSGNYRVTTGNSDTSQALHCEGRAVGVNRTYDFGITGTTATDIDNINQQIFALVDKPIEGRLMYLSEPLTEDVRLSGTGVIRLLAAPDKGVGSISAAVVEIGRVRNMEASRANAWSLSVGTGNNLLGAAPYTLPYGGGISGNVTIGVFRNPSEVGSFMNYKYVTVGYADVQNPDYDGKAWFEVPEQNYIPNFYFQTTKIVPGQYYPYTIELDPYDYIFHAGSKIGVMIFGTDPDYCELYDECCIPEFDIKIGADSYAVLPLTKNLGL